MSQNFSNKAIRLEISLGEGSFAGGGNTKVIEGLACDVTVRKVGVPSKNDARVKVWGLSYADMAQLTMLAFKPLESQHNLISIWAGEKSGAGGGFAQSFADGFTGDSAGASAASSSGSGSMALVFQGEITSAFADFNAAPDVCMEFEADSGIYPQQLGLPVAAVQGEVKAEQLFEKFAAQAGYTFKNEGVTSSVRDACFPGSPYDKLSKLARYVGCDLFIDDGAVVVMPAGQAREGDTVYLSKDTGLIGYPTFTQDGISCRCFFNPGLEHGGLIQVQSMVPRASGLWRINGLTHNLSADTPGGGSWESQIEAAFYE